MKVYAVIILDEGLDEDSDAVDYCHGIWKTKAKAEEEAKKHWGGRVREYDLGD